MSRDKELNKIARSITQALRHQPDKLGLTLSESGWADVKTLIKNVKISLLELESIVSNDNKGRFSFNASKTLIRANQGHSLESVVINYAEVIDAPEELFHGTSASLSEKILKSGLLKMNRNHVHLSKDLETALTVGKRKGDNVILFYIQAKKMVEDGVKIYISENGVYLTDYVDPKYLEKHDFIIK